MELDNKAKRKALLAQLRELPPVNRAEDIITLLDARRRGEKRRPSRACGDLLPYRYASDPEVNLGSEIISLSVFVNLAHYLSKHDVLILARDSSLFAKAKGWLKDEELPSTWSDSLRKWSKTSPLLGLQFYCEVRCVQMNPHKRGADTPAPEPKRRCVTQSESRDARAENRSLANADHDSEDPEPRPSGSGVGSTNTTTMRGAHTPKTQQTPPGVQATDTTIPVSQGQPQPADGGGSGTRNNVAALTPEAQKKIMTTALSRCHVVVYPVDVFSELIRPTGEGVRFYRPDSGAHGYRSSGFGPSAGQFYIRASQEILEELGHVCEGEEKYLPRSVVRVLKMLTSQTEMIL
ncbi:hypothetical protein CTA1_2065 [Colletotrichum tanaceti]|uniref:Uncharacterized protein n=1 Tax=Colletotrichum tanaceti TaxID=1306861 RepID=A0A4U6XCQ9_9PEZI|nr:hypothetical protein CTA1_2065 [Colletotrichum tanaceti]